MISLFGYHSHSIDLAYPYRYRYAVLSFVLLIAASLLIFCSLLNVRQTSLFMLGLCLWVLALSGLRLSVLAFRYGRQLEAQQAQESTISSLEAANSQSISSALQSALYDYHIRYPNRNIHNLAMPGPGGAPPAFDDRNTYECSQAVEPPNPYQLWSQMPPPPNYSDLSEQAPPPKYEEMPAESSDNAEDPSLPNVDDRHPDATLNEEPRNLPVTNDIEDASNESASSNTRFNCSQ